MKEFEKQEGRNLHRLSLFDQEYATEAYANEKLRRGIMKNSIEVYQECGVSIEETINRFAARFAISAKEASKYVRRFWKNKPLMREIEKQEGRNLHRLFLFDQEYAIKAYTEELCRRGERIGEIKSVVGVCRDVGMPVEEIIQRLMARFDITAKKASQYVRRFWTK